MRLVPTVGALALVAAVAAPSLAHADPPQAYVLNGEGDNLWVYDADDPSDRKILIRNADDDPDGLDINAEICTLTSDDVDWVPDGEQWFIAGEDTGQNTGDIIRQGWGLFRLDGDDVASFSAEQMGKLVPDSYVTTSSNYENYGCGVLPDGRLVTTDVGDQLPHEPATGQLIVYFPEAEHFTGPIDPQVDRTLFERVPHCKVDITIGTAGGMEVEEIRAGRPDRADPPRQGGPPRSPNAPEHAGPPAGPPARSHGDAKVFVASNRPNLDSVDTFAPGGIYEYDTSDWPTSEDDCIPAEDGSLHVAPDAIGKSLFIPQSPLLMTPSDIVHSGNGTYYVSSVFTGHVAEFDSNGLFLRYVASPPVGPLAVPTPTGQVTSFTPFGIGVTPDGSLWIADIGIQGTGPAAGEGEVYVVTFDDLGLPSTPVSVNDGLNFPDGIGVFTR